MERTFGSLRVVLLTGDLTNQPSADAIVNAANRQLKGGNGVCGAIFKAAGWDDMQAACDFYYPADENGVRCPTGQARTTTAFKLLNKAVIHAVGPIYDPGADPDVQDRLLLDAYYASMMEAHVRGYNTIGFPAISCGIFKYPLDRAAGVAITAMQCFAEDYPDSPLTEAQFVFLHFGDGPEVRKHFTQALWGRDLHDQVVDGIARLMVWLKDQGQARFSLGDALAAAKAEDTSETAESYIFEFVKDGIPNLRRETIDTVVGGDLSPIWNMVNPYLQRMTGLPPVEPNPEEGA